MLNLCSRLTIFASRPEQLMRGFDQKIPFHHQLAELRVQLVDIGGANLF